MSHTRTLPPGAAAARPHPAARASAAAQAEVDFAAKVRPQGRPRPTDLAIAEFASRQHGVLTAAQLTELGLSPRAIRHRAATGRLRRVHRGVYAVERPRSHGRWMAAVLACGPGAALSHTSAASLWGLTPDPAGVVHVNVAGARRHGRSGLIVHRAELAEDDVTTHEGIPCTTVARALVDASPLLSTARLERAIALADELGRFDLTAVRDQIDGMPGQRGTGRLAVALAGFDDREDVRSVAEARFLALVARARLPRPEVNVWIPLPDGGGYRPDFLWRDRRLIVEVDGREHHALRRAFEHDRRRDRRLFQAGFATLRFPAREVLSRPREVVTELRAVLGPSRPGI